MHLGSPTTTCEQPTFLVIAKANLRLFLQPPPKRLGVPPWTQIPLHELPRIFCRSTLQNRSSILQTRTWQITTRREEPLRKGLDEHLAVDVRVVSTVVVDQVVEGMLHLRLEVREVAVFGEEGSDEGGRFSCVCSHGI